MWNKLLMIDNNWLKAINNLAYSNKFWQDVFKFFGVYLIYGVPILLVVLWFWAATARKVALRATFAGLISWLVASSLIGHFVNRPRPFESGGIKEIIFHRPTYSFPSDHAAFLFALGFSFWLSGYKKLGIVTFLAAILVSFGRIGLGIHYPSDIIAGAVLGIIIAWIIWLLDRHLNYLYNFLVDIARKLRLA